jgi:hypothetical protein
MAQTPQIITFPRTFPADIAYRIGAGVFCLPGVIGITRALMHHDIKSILLLGLPFLFFAAAFLLTLSFDLTVDENGLHQRSLLGRKEVLWSDVQRVEQSRAYSIHGAGTPELVWLSMVSTAAQQAIAEESVRLAGLHSSGEKLVYPMRNQWIR